MIQWLIDHWHMLTAAIGGPIAIIWAWFSAHKGHIRTCYDWVRKQFRLPTQNRDLTEQLALVAERQAETDTAKQQSDSRAQQLKVERDVLAERLAANESVERQNAKKQEQKLTIVREAVAQGRPVCHCTEIGEAMILTGRGLSGYFDYRCPSCKRREKAPDVPGRFAN